MEDKSQVIRSRHMQEILGAVPPWMIRWGNTLVFLLALGLMALAYFIQYPDFIPMEVTVNRIEATRPDEQPSVEQENTKAPIQYNVVFEAALSSAKSLAAGHEMRIYDPGLTNDTGVKAIIRQVENAPHDPNQILIYSHFEANDLSDKGWLLEARPGLKLQVEIITDDMRLSERILQGFRGKDSEL